MEASRDILTVEDSLVSPCLEPQRDGGVIWGEFLTKQLESQKSATVDVLLLNVVSEVRCS